MLNGHWFASQLRIITGSITFADVAQTFPFGNTVDLIELAGKDLIEVFEHSVEDYDTCAKHGKFLQVAGYFRTDLIPKY